MKQIIDEYGGVILQVIVGALCLLMYTHVWFGSGGEGYGSASLFSENANIIFNAKLKYDVNDKGKKELVSPDMTNVSTADASDFNSKLYITNPDGTSYLVSDKTVAVVQDKTASKTEEINARYAPKLFSFGSQNATDALLDLDFGTIRSDNQLITKKTYSSSELFYGVEYDENGTAKGVITRFAKNAAGEGQLSGGFYDGTPNTGYMRILSLSTADGREIVSDCSKYSRDNIAFYNVNYTNKKGAAGDKTAGDLYGFTVYTPEGDEWLTYSIADEKWTFDKAGTYCFRVFVCDSKGKTNTSTVYISVASGITTNKGDGKADEHNYGPYY